MSALIFHPQHGVNPSLPVCAFCGQPTGEILLLGYNRGKEAKHLAIYNPHQPCKACAEKMSYGITFIEAIPHPDHDWVPGAWIVIKEESNLVQSIEPKELKDHILKARQALVPPADWDEIGLPREDKG
jgi:recombinational DNA repair protein (RecF pathway)